MKDVLTESQGYCSIPGVSHCSQIFQRFNLKTTQEKVCYLVELTLTA